MHFQDIISTLNRFWADQGCLLLQPYDTEKGAGTMSPHTVLRAIGPEPWAGPSEPAVAPPTAVMATTQTGSALFPVPGADQASPDASRRPTWRH